MGKCASKTQGEQGQSNEPSAISYLRGVKRIRLDVIDTNPRAKKLYKQKGFEVVKEEVYLYLSWLLGFGVSSTM